MITALVYKNSVDKIISEEKTIEKITTNHNHKHDYMEVVSGQKQYFKNVERIAFEGVESDNPL
ncbi:MAG: hypothetical protein ACJ75B_00320, partial [Flavisolibacter sp.]